jgi:MoaA/NifB/PqqE/SkfB family radical SAM enzyme
MKLKKVLTSTGIVYLSAPAIVNIQLNNYCPLKCPFCYMKFENKIDMNLIELDKHLGELMLLGTRSILFGQGEPMCYPNIYDAVKLAKEKGFHVRIATGGVGCSYNKFRRLKAFGLDVIYISLNSFDKEKNDISREGYDYAINAIKMAIQASIKVVLNYVAQESTISVFYNYIQEAKKMGVNEISILREKVKANGNIGNYTKQSLMKLADVINTDEISIGIEECFCELNVIVKDRILTPLQGCAAGRTMMAITVDNCYLPCPHLRSKKEKANSINEYWTSSIILENLRKVRLTEKPCLNCSNIRKCTPCQAIFIDDRDNLSFSRKECPISTYKRRLINGA